MQSVKNRYELGFPILRIIIQTSAVTALRFKVHSNHKSTAKRLLRMSGSGGPRMKLMCNVLGSFNEENA